MALGLGSNLIVRDGGVPGVVVRLGKPFATVERLDCHDFALRRRGERHPRLLHRARRRDRRRRVPALDPRHGRRLRADERRRLWPRGPRHPGRMRSRAAFRAAADAAHWTNSATPTATASCRRARRRLRDLPRPCRRARRDPGRDGPDRRGARGEPAAAQPHRRLDLQEPAGHEGLAGDRRMPAAAAFASAMRRSPRSIATSCSTSARRARPTSRRWARRCAAG